MSKPFLDGRCEWHRGGLRINGVGSIDPFLQPQPECANKAPNGVQWCAEHKCSDNDCTLAVVKDGKCVGHQPGSLKSLRIARLAEVSA